MFSKTAYEEIFRYRDFAPWLAAGVILTSVTVKSYELPAMTDMSSSMISGAAPYGSPATKAKFLLKAGTAGKRYMLAVQAVTSDGQKFESQIVCKVD